jgi:hypothetical protein
MSDDRRKSIGAAEALIRLFDEDSTEGHDCESFIVVKTGKPIGDPTHHNKLFIRKCGLCNKTLELGIVAGKKELPKSLRHGPCRYFKDWKELWGRIRPERKAEEKKRLLQEAARAAAEARKNERLSAEERKRKAFQANKNEDGSVPRLGQQDEVKW